MTTLQKLTVRASEIRQSLNTLATVESLTDEQRTESDTLTTEYRDVETKLRAATIADGVADLGDQDERETEATTPEGRERAKLEERANLGTLMQNIIEARAHAGVEKELLEAFKLAGNEIPLSLLEVRAVTPATGGRGAESGADHPGRVPFERAYLHGHLDTACRDRRSGISRADHERDRSYSRRKR